MKRKRSIIFDSSGVRWHLILFVVVSIALWMSMIATFNYSGNASVPFSVFKPLLIERFTLTIGWGLVILAHVVFSQLRENARYRDHQIHLNMIQKTDENYAQRLDFESKFFDDEQTLNEDSEFIARTSNKND